MPVFRVTFDRISPKNSKPEFVNFECEHATVADLTEAVNSGIVAGMQIHAEKIEGKTPRSFKVVGRSPFSLSSKSITSIARLPVRMYDEDGKSLHEDATRRSH